MSIIEDRSLVRDRVGFSEALHSHLMLATGFLIRDRGVTGPLMLATGFVIRDRVVTEGETSTQAWKACATKQEITIPETTSTSAAWRSSHLARVLGKIQQTHPEAICIREEAEATPARERSGDQ